MQKTALRLLMDSLLTQMNGIDRDNSKLRQEHYILSGIYDYAKELLIKEKDQLGFSYRCGVTDGLENKIYSSEKHFNNTYTQK